MATHARRRAPSNIRRSPLAAPAIHIAMPISQMVQWRLTAPAVREVEASVGTGSGEAEPEPCRMAVLMELAEISGTTAGWKKRSALPAISFCQEGSAMLQRGTA